MQAKLKAIAVYCGSNMGNNVIYSEVAKQMGIALAEAELTLIYGGAKVGLMGVIADTILELGGKVIGVMPQSLVNHEVAHNGLTDLHIVNSMHERKELMANLSDGFIMLPGGPGTLEEFFEITTWAKLGYHQKPCGILNINHYYDLILQFFDHMISEDFFHSHYRNMIQVDQSPHGLLQKFFQYKAPVANAWINTPLVHDIV